MKHPNFTRKFPANYQAVEKVVVGLVGGPKTDSNTTKTGIKQP
jgi:hypothetical protein